MQSPAQINQKLRDTFGFQDGKPKFRLAWSEQGEIRGCNYTENNIELPYEEFKERRKYNYIKDRWIVEMLIPFSHPSIKSDIKYTYENVYTFLAKDKDGKLLPPIWDVCELIAKVWTSIVHRETAFGHKEQHFDDLEDEQSRRDQAELFDALQHEAPYLQQGVVVPSNYVSEKIESK